LGLGLKKHAFQIGMIEDLIEGTLDYLKSFPTNQAKIEIIESLESLRRCG
jgi:hypothetical protein